MMLIFWSLVVSFLWSLSPILEKYIFKSGIHVESVMLIGGIFYLVPLAIYGLCNIQTIRKDLCNSMNLQVLSIIAASTVMTVFLANIINFHLVKNNPSYIVTALTFTSPVFTMIFAALILKENVTRVSLLGVTFIVAGVILLSMA